MDAAPAPARRSAPGAIGAIAARPAVGAAVLFIAGIALHTILPPRPLVWIVAIALLAVGAIVCYRITAPCSACIAGALLLCGVAVAQLEAYFYPADHISSFATDEMRLAQLEMRIDTPPRVLSAPFGRFRSLPPKQVATATALRVRTWSGWAEASGQMLVQIAHPHPRLALGQHVRVVGMLQRPGPAMNPGQFDWSSYYREQRILASVQIPEASNLTILSADAPSPLARLRDHSRRLLATGFPANRSLDHALLRALLLGDSDPELRDVQDQFRRTGTGHHLAISGLHIAVLGGFVFLILRVLCAPPRLASWIVVAFVVLYGLAALPSPPVVRSVLLCVAFALGIVQRRSLDGIQLLSLSVLAMLIYHPLDLYNAGFQLSFGVVLGLMIFATPMMRFLTSFRDRDKQVADQLTRPRDALDAAARWTDEMILATIASGLVAWFVSMPLIAYHFEQLNPWAIPASIALAPIVFAALIGGLLKIVLTLLWPGAAGAWAAMATGPVALMRHAVDWLAMLPGSDVPMPAPPVWLIALYYGAMFLIFLPTIRPGLRWCLRGAPLAACVALFLLPFTTGASRPEPAAPDELRLTLLAVGAGQCCVIEPPSGRTVLVDAGSTSLADLTLKCLGPFLRHRGVTDVDTIFISHANYDHFSAVADVTSAYDVREVLTAQQFRGQCAGNAPGEAMLLRLDELERPPRSVAPGDELPLGRRTRIEILWPPRGLSASPELANDESMVLRLRHGDRTILFTGDIQEAALRTLLKDPASLKADILVAPHHGSCEPSTAAFVAAVNPSVILSSNDRTLTTKQRNFEKLIGSRELYRTHRCGAIAVKIDRNGQIIVRPYLPR